MYELHAHVGRRGVETWAAEDPERQPTANLKLNQSQSVKAGYNVPRGAQANFSSLCQISFS